MSLSSVTNSTNNSIATTAGTTPTTASTAAAGQTMDKDAFMKLLVAQMSNQDPLQPQDSTTFVTQLSQFAMVEQSTQQSTQLGVISTQLTGMSSNSATDLVGKNVSIRGSGISYDGTNATGSSVNLDNNASKVTVQIQDANGNTVRTLNIGAHAAGPMPITWDGKTDAGGAAPSGKYTVQVSASAADGSPVTASQNVSGKVVKVSFDKGYPEILLDSGVTAPISDLVGVGQ